ncbi:prepilin peptidase [Methylobacterium nonmethylotrophicum]|uniref:Prepilin peptidase n=1 Tax=Methylobacterium nonmethylotrophicum TaxID=1141884 RepID=A0A4Z0NRZ5_9HYPH|nr:prepilin peptidase [Methylobacterium nonmethylotrophicum]TGD98714.1 prepilin peptidase [Methylobacterium nonmethylotrophicum]
MSAALLAGAVLPALLPLPLTLPASLIDLRQRIIPDALNLALLVLGLAVAAWRDGAGGAGLGLLEAGLAYGLFRALRAGHARLSGRIGLGLGDVKFVAAAAAWTGLAGLPVLILAASLSALAAVGLAALAGRPVGRTTVLPFGPFLAFGLHAALLHATLVGAAV